MVAKVYPAINCPYPAEDQAEASLMTWWTDQMHLVLAGSSFGFNDADYFDYATRIELAVASERWNEAYEASSAAVKHARAPWEFETTANNYLFFTKRRTSPPLRT